MDDVPAERRAHLELNELPPGLVAKLAFDRAAPKRLRNADLPPEAREIVAGIWDSVVADVWDQVADQPRRALLDRNRVAQVLGAVAETAQQGERALVVTAVHHPLPGAATWKQATVAGLGAAGSATVSTLTVLGSAGVGAAVALTAAVVGELVETYVAASARTHQYRRARRQPDPALVAADLAEALGEPGLTDRRVDRELLARSLAYLARTLVPRTAGRFTKALVPVAGAVAAGGLAGRDVVRVTSLPLRAPNEEELHRMARDLDDTVVADMDEDLERFRALPPPPHDPRTDPRPEPPRG